MEGISALKSLLSPKNDFVFKKLFTKDVEILKNLVNCVLARSRQGPVVSIDVKNSDILPDELDRKFIILDIRAVDGSGHEYDIEMQVRKYDNYPKRTLYYLCRMYGDQLKSGEDYTALHPVIGIHFLDYAPFPASSDFHYRFVLRDIRHPDLTLNDDLSLHIFELPAIEKHVRRDAADNLLEWLYFFNNAHEQGGDAMEKQYHNPMIHKALDALKSLSADERTRELAERREKALKDEAMFLNEAKKHGREEGREEGRKEGKRQTALRLLQMGLLSVDQIADATGLDLREIEQLKTHAAMGSGDPSKA